MYEDMPMKENRIKNMSIFDFYDWVEYNTDQNYHTENIVIIAMRFGDEDDIEVNLEITYLIKSCLNLTIRQETT